jgi:hypothetical protein
MAVAGEIASSLPQKPTNLPSSDNEGLSIGATFGIGVGIALLVILVALGTWIFVRRWRRTWAQKRKRQIDLESTGDTSNEEITKRLFEYGKSNDNGEDKEMRMNDSVKIVEVGRIKGDLDPIDGAQQEEKQAAEKSVYEMPTAAEPVEIGEVNHFAAELEGSAVAHTASSTEKNETCLVDPGNAQK